VLAKVQSDSIPIGKRGQVRRITLLSLDLPSLKSGRVRNDLDKTLWFYFFPAELGLEGIRSFKEVIHRFIHNDHVAATCKALANEEGIFRFIRISRSNGINQLTPRVSHL